MAASGRNTAREVRSTEASEIDSTTARLFCALWGVGWIFHYLSQVKKGWHELPLTSTPLLLLAVVIVIRPTLPRLFVVACGLHAIDVTIKTFLETVHVSWFLSGTISMTLVVGFLRGSRTTDSLVRTCAPTIRAMALVIYFYAVFHKLNAGYFAPQHTFPQSRISGLPLVGSLEILGTHAAAFGLATEALIGVFLAVPRARPLGVLLGILLHGALGYTGYIQFAFLFPVYLLFLWPPGGPALAAFWSIVVPRNLRRILALTFVASCAAIATFHETVARGQRLGRILWCLLLFSVVVSLIAYACREYRSFGKNAFTVRFSAGPVLLALWCFLPYFGIMDHPCIAMYSELQVDSGRSNHWIVPAALQLEAFQGDVVRIEEVQGARNRRRYPVGRQVPYLGLRHALLAQAKRSRAPKRLVYSRNGASYEVIDGDMGESIWWDRVPIIDYNYLLITRAEKTRLSYRKKLRKKAKKKGAEAIRRLESSFRKEDAAAGRHRL